MARATRNISLDWLSFKSKSSFDYPILVNTTGYYEAVYSFESYNPLGRDDYYLIYVVEGELFLDMPNFTQAIGKGTAFIIPPKHMYKYSGKKYKKRAMDKGYHCQSPLTHLLIIIYTKMWIKSNNTIFLYSSLI